MAANQHQTMRIEDVRVDAIAGHRIEVAARCAGQPPAFRVPEASGVSRSAVGDALLLCALAPAMRAGAPLQFPEDLPVSSRLASNLDGIQRIWASWNPSLSPVRVDASLYEPAPSTGLVGLGYAGGIDSSYSLIAHFDEIEALLLVFGFDHTLSDTEMAASIERNGRFAQRVGKTLVPVETNHSRFLFALGVSRTLVYGATLASIGLLLGLRRCYLASGHSAAYPGPAGSHPVLDYRYSNGATDIVHDDTSVGRFEKTRVVAGRPEFLENVIVCWEHPNSNCGDCPKCLRTMTALRLCGTTGPFPPLGDLRRIREMASHSEAEYVLGMLLAARAAGDEAIARELARGLRARDRREALRYIDLGFLGGTVHRVRRRLRSRQNRPAEIEPRPDLD